MTSDANEEDGPNIAKVALQEAVAFDPDSDDPDDTNSWELMNANDFDPEEHKHFEFYCSCCLDKKQKVRLRKPSPAGERELLFDVLDRKTKKPLIDDFGDPVIIRRNFLFPARFSTWKKEKHVCDIVKKQRKLNEALKESGATEIDTESELTLIDLNIDTEPDPFEKNRRPFTYLSPKKQFNGDAPSKPNRPNEYKLHISGNTQHIKNQGVSSVKDLARLLDKTEFDLSQRRTILLKNDGIIQSLDNLYHRKNIKMYRALYKKELKVLGDIDADHNNTTLSRFKTKKDLSDRQPNSDGSVSITSKIEKIRDQNGRSFNVATRLNFQNAEAFQEFQRIHNSTKNKEERGFLIYSEHSTVNVAKHRDQRGKIDSGEKNATVYIEATIYNKDQVMQWSPRKPKQLTICKLPTKEVIHTDPTAVDLSMH